MGSSALGVLVPKDQILQVSIIQPSGLILFHQSFLEQPLDELLFSGLIAALIAFSKEMGTELASIKLATNEFFVETDEQKKIITVVGVSQETSKQFVETFMNTLKQNKNFKALLDKILEQDFVQVNSQDTQKFRDLILSILKDMGSLPVEKSMVSQSIPNLKDSINLVLKDLMEGNKTPKEIAEAIFGEGLEKKTPQVIEEKVQVLKDVFESGTIHDSMKSAVKELIKYLERSLRASQAFGF